MVNIYIKKIEDYIEKARSIFTYLNQFRQNPKLLAKRLELLRTYLDTETNVLSEPNKIQIQMVEGDSVFKEAIEFLKSLQPLQPLEWSDSLASSAMEHVTDIGPKGLLSYQSSDGTEPEDRIGKYGNFSESLGENIDFGPNDALGVLISMTLDDGEEQRPHRENLFKGDYHKVGIACGPHKTEFQMCVMDFAFDFTPINENKGKQNVNNNYSTPNTKGYNNDPVVNLSVHDNQNNNKLNDYKIKMNKEDMLNNSNFMNNQSPLVKLSLDPEDMTRERTDIISNNANYNHYMGDNYGSNNVKRGNNQYELEDLANKTKNLLSNLKIIQKKVEVVTKITYVYEDGSTREVSDTQSHTFKY